MKDNSFFSLIILLVLFFVLPSVLKLLGQHTLNSKNAQKRQAEENAHQAPGGEPAAYQEEIPPRVGPEGYDHPVVSNEPINPKWF